MKTWSFKLTAFNFFKYEISSREINNEDQNQYTNRHHYHYKNLDLKHYQEVRKKRPADTVAIVDRGVLGSKFGEYSAVPSQLKGIWKLSVNPMESWSKTV